MGRVRRRFDTQFKKAVCQAINEGKSINEVCKDHQLHRQTVLAWLRKDEQGQPLGNPSTREKALEKQVYALQAKVGQLSMENEFLKKIKKQLQLRRNVKSSVITGKNLDQFQKPVKR